MLRPAFARSLPATVVVLLVIALAGCAGSRANEPAESASGTAGFPLTLTHALGEATIESKPERIVTLGEDLDTLAALGIVPVGYVPVAPGYTDDVPYQADRIDLSGAEVIEGASAEEYSVEQIAALQPDLILATNLYGVESIYAQLAAIAPTVAYEKGWGETSWQDVSRTIGQAVGEPDAAEAAVAETEQYLADLKTELPGLEGRTVAGAFYHTAGTFAANPHSASMDKYTALGMVVKPELLEAVPEGSGDNSVSLEKIQVLDADVLFLSFGSADLQAELESSQLYRNLSAVKSGTAYVNDPADPLPTFAGNGPTLLNIVWLLDQQHATLAKAAGQ